MSNQWAELKQFEINYVHKSPLLKCELHGVTPFQSTVLKLGGVS
jgi:hypothetical protein